MTSFYTTVLILCWMALGILCILTRENDRLSRSSKRWFYLTYAIVAAASAAEWSGVMLDGTASSSSLLLLIVKCLDYILTPMAGAAIVGQMQLRNFFDKILGGLIAFNTLLQLFCCFNGGMISIDASNHYTHGPLYPLYVAIYLSIIFLIFLQFRYYGQLYRRQNLTSLYAIMILVFTSIAMQEFLGPQYRTSYLGMTFGAALLFIHYTEFSQQAQDEIIAVQETQIMTDPLTGLLSRAAYSDALNTYDSGQKLPEDLAAFAIDINGLKNVNDLYGHTAGDELICGAAQCIELTFGPEGRCYRTGGDEFMVLTNMDRDAADAALAELDRRTKSWTGEYVHDLHLASGYALASDWPHLSAEKLVSKADDYMYAAKADYYRQADNDRRYNYRTPLAAKQPNG